MPLRRKASTFGRHGRFAPGGSGEVGETGHHRPRKYGIEQGRLGLDVMLVRQIISIRKKEPAEVEEQETLLELYQRALGM